MSGEQEPVAALGVRDEVVGVPASSDAGRTVPVDRVTLAGIEIDRVTMREAEDRIIAALAEGRGGWVVTPNLDHLARAHRDPVFLSLVSHADLVLADGMPLIWASRVQGTPLPERVAGSTLVRSLAARAAEEGRTLFLLGGNPGAAEGAAAALQRETPSLKVTGTYCPPLGFETSEEEMARIEAALEQAKPDLVYVALGSPKQEKLILTLRKRLPQAWWLGVGISLSFLAGEVSRAPAWMQKSGLEWIHRLVQEPRRLWRRYLVNGIPFAVRLLWSSWRRRGVEPPTADS
ncbi:MAG: WecB/TagA/CpsF family glycosyltransferase [Rhodospirillales bacterium]|nr:WecB/TagA/CpsF family glycosyltransferase [Rhodospirillales bacterium]